jgi:hypothetical protein
MGYSPTYDATDLSEATIDLGAKSILEIGIYITIIVLVGLGVWAINVFRKRFK